MSFTEGLFLELEQLPQGIDGEMPFGILLLVDNARRQGLFGGLTLEDLLLDCPRGYETIDKACGLRLSSSVVSPSSIL